MAHLHWLRFVGLVSTCVAFGLVSHVGGLDGRVGTWCVFCWAFSFTGSLFVLMADFCLKDYVPNFFPNFSVTIFGYGALLCLYASIIFPYVFLKGQLDYDVQNHRVAAEVFSCFATLAYLVEVWMAWVESKYFMATTQCLLQVCQTFVAGIIFCFISNPVSYTYQLGVMWCMAVYCLCFIFSVVSILRCVFCNKYEPDCLKFLNVCSAFMYLSATIIWPVFKFSSHYPSEIFPPKSCQEGLRLCPWGTLVVVSVLTALNCLLYLLSVFLLCKSGSEEQYDSISHISISQVNPSFSGVRQIQQRAANLCKESLVRHSRCNPRNYQSTGRVESAALEQNVFNVTIHKQTVICGKKRNCSNRQHFIYYDS